MIGRACMLSACLAVALAAAEAPPEAVPAVEASPVPGALAVVTVPDPARLITNVAAFAAGVGAPVTAEQVSASLGEAIGDAGLQGFDRSRPLLLVVQAPPHGMAPPTAVAIFAVTDAAPYQTAASAKGWNATVLDDGRVALSKAALPEQDLAAIAAAHAAVQGTHDLRARVDLAAIAKAYGPTISNAGMMVAGLAGAQDPRMAAAAPLIQGYFVALLDLLEDSEAFQADVSFGGERLAVDTIYAAKPGTALAGLMSAPDGDALAAQHLLPKAASVMRLSYAMNEDALRTWLQDVLDRLAQDPFVGPQLTDEVRAQAASMVDLVGDRFASQMRFEDGALRQEMVARVGGLEDPVEAIASWMSLIEGDGLLAQVYREQGITFAFERDVRRIGDIPVHRLNVEIDADKAALNPDEQKMMAALMSDYEFAVVGEWLLGGGDKALDGMIARALGQERGDAAQMRAAERFGAGHHLYVDYDLVAYFRTIMAMMAEQNVVLGNMARLKDAEPMTAAGSFADGRMRTQVHVPTALFRAFTDAFRPQPAPEGEGGVF